MVCDKGDILLICIHPIKSNVKFLDFIQPKIMNYLADQKGVKFVSQKGNDIEVNGKKLFGSSTSYRMGMVTEGLFINGVSKKIDAIGHKGKKREIVSLSGLGIDLKDFRKWLIETVKELEGK